MKKYLVTCEETCAECDGDGYVQNPVYDALGDQDDDWYRQGYTDKERCKKRIELMEKLGFPGGPSCWPAEEIKCKACQGKGLILYQTTLERAMSDVFLAMADKGQS